MNQSDGKAIKMFFNPILGRLLSIGESGVVFRYFMGFGRVLERKYDAIMKISSYFGNFREV